LRNLTTLSDDKTTWSNPVFLLHLKLLRLESLGLIDCGGWFFFEESQRNRQGIYTTQEVDWTNVATQPRKCSECKTKFTPIGVGQWRRIMCYDCSPSKSEAITKDLDRMGEPPPLPPARVEVIEDVEEYEDEDEDEDVEEYEDEHEESILRIMWRRWGQKLKKIGQKLEDRANQ